MGNNVKQVKLGDITTYNKGFAFNSKEYTDEGTMVVRVSDFTQESVSKDNAVYISEKDKYEPFRLNTDDILIQTVGSWANNPNSIVGKVVKVPKDCAGMYLNQNIVRIIPKEGFNNRYLYYALKANKFPYYCVMRGQGAANQASITLDTIFRFKFNAHDEEAQDRIASILSTYDDLIEKNNRKIEILQEMAEELYKEWFVRFRFPGYKTAKFTDGIPDGWKVKKANEIFDITIGRTPSRAIFSYFTDEREGNYSWISISDMRNKMFVSDTKEYLTKEAINSCNMPMVAPNTVLLSFKLTVGQVSITTEETSTNEAIAHFNTQDENLREYTYLYLQNFNYNELGNTSAIGNAINSTIVKNMKFVLPDEDLLVKFKGIAGNIVDTILLLTKQNNNLKQQRDLLLPRLMSGKLEVKVKQEV